MKMSWLGTTAVALVIGSGAVIAQSQTDPKREEGPRAPQTQPKEAERPSATDEPAKKERTAQPETKGQEGRRGEGQQERKQQAQEPRERPPQQSQDQPRSREGKQPDTKQQRGQEGQPKDNQARDTKQPEPTQQSQPARSKQDNQARDGRQPSDSKQQQGQREPSAQTDGSKTSPSPSGQSQQNSVQPSDPSRPAGTANGNERRQIVDRLRGDRSGSRQNIDIQVSIGGRLPPRARLQRLPPDIVRIAPRYRGYEYTVVEDRVYVVEPKTRRVVDIISESGPSRTSATVEGRGPERVVIAQEQRETFKQVARRGMTSAPTSAPSASMSDQSCLQLQPVPEEVMRNNPELGQYRYLRIGEQIILIDPRQQTVVQIIE